MDNIDITPKSQLLDSSITKITPAIGVPITEAPTDAIPHNAKALKSVAIPKKLIKLAKTIPDAAPTNNAGEKTPPKREPPPKRPKKKKKKKKQHTKTKKQKTKKQTHKKK